MPDASHMPSPEEFLAVDTPREILERLIAFPTVSRDSNLALIDWVEGWLTARGIPSTRVPNADGTKAQIYAHTGPWEDGGVLLSGHTDVVPVDGQKWSTDPFTLTERDGRLYGRGTTDMKGFVALALWAMGEAARRGIARPLQIALSRDEEIGCVGAPEMLAHMAEAGFQKADAAIIGEPTMLTAVTSHKGGQAWWITAKGHEVHSSIMHTGVSAILESVKVVTLVNELNAENVAKPRTPAALMFDPPWTTVHTGVIQGGTVHNITAGACEFGFDVRLIPGETAAQYRARLFARLGEVEAGMQAVHPDTGFTVEERFGLPPLAPEPDGAAERLVRQITGDNGTHAVSYGTEAGHFQAAGYSAVVCGPGDIAIAHQPDEFITIAQFEGGQAFLKRLLDHLQKEV